MPRCEACGRFHVAGPGSSWAVRFSGWPPMPDHEVTRCVRCTERLGPLDVQHGIAASQAGVVSPKELVA